MGKFSRNKGKRNEYSLRDYLRKQGYQAERVPSSGNANGFPGDIHAIKDGKTTVFELKARKCSFAAYHDLIATLKNEDGTDRIGLTVPGLQGQCVDISGSIGGIYDTEGVYEMVHNHRLYERYKSAFKRLATLEKWKGPADILVVKDDHHPFVFFRFR